jgi:2-keto-4-pentenoate hydratase/2-oxohepta-3-ene-1,7-dioic acid hydratase in catechol pathway
MPHIFAKYHDSITGPGKPVIYPKIVRQLDIEGELTAVIGKRAYHVEEADALDYVAGYTIANDLSARDAMRREKVPAATPFHYDWLSQKCFDGACPTGPWIVPASQIGDPHKLAIRLWVNDELMQDSSTGKMIFDTAEQIAMLSSRVTLYPGDLVLTGTPAGVGMPRQRFLQPGDKLRLTIEKIGELTHRVA